VAGNHQSTEAHALFAIFFYFMQLHSSYRVYRLHYITAFLFVS